MEEDVVKKGYPLILDTYVPELFNKLKKSLVRIPETLIEILDDLHKIGSTVYFSTFQTLLMKKLLESDDLNRCGDYRYSTEALMQISNLMLGTHVYFKGFLRSHSENLKKRFYYM